MVAVLLIKVSQVAIARIRSNLMVGQVSVFRFRVHVITDHDGIFSGCAYYASATNLQPSFYKALLDRGWRRSGSVLYKPDVLASCCSSYAIRLDSYNFQASKDQRQTLNRFNRNIVGNAYIAEAARVNPRTRAAARRRDNEFDVVQRVHESEEAHMKRPPEPAHRLRIVLGPDDYTDEKYALFENYQRIVHREPPHKIRRSGFRDFLCSSPLVRSSQIREGKEQRLGSYHQCYYIDNELVAMSVLDLLPDCVSAVYFLYHDSVHHYNLGKLSAMREIAFAKEEGYRWWYAGLYIHNCTKMKYKGTFAPSYLLDPETYVWRLMDTALTSQLDAHRYVSQNRKIPIDSIANCSDDDTPSKTDSSISSISSDSKEEQEEDDDDDTDGHRSGFMMPGAVSKDQILKVNLDHIKLHVRGTDAETSDLVGWSKQSIDDSSSLKAIIAELVAVVGIDLAQNMCITFGMR